MPFANSRNRLSPYYRVSLDVFFSRSSKGVTDNVFIIERVPLDDIQTEHSGDTVLTVTDGKRQDHIAYEQYRDDTLHWLIPLRNNVGDIFSIETGTEMSVPSFSRVQELLR